jgi:hypothetical protein
MCVEANGQTRLLVVGSGLVVTSGSSRSIVSRSSDSHEANRYRGRLRVVGIIGRPILKGVNCRGNRTAEIDFAGVNCMGKCRGRLQG